MTYLSSASQPRLMAKAVRIPRYGWRLSFCSFVLSGYSWIAHQLHSGTSVIIFAADGSETSAQTTRVNVLDFFEKPKNGISASFTKRR